MKTVAGFKLRTVAGEPVLLAEGVNQVDFNKVIYLNASAATLWQAIEGRDFTVEDLAEVLMSNYDIDRETALADCAEIAAQWVANGLVAND